ncbi:hypothetical protein [Nocardia niwae]|uniref:hypothetical protein n=1 Tax=Nocardia niwae TaxID=626084 RepID=UPI0033F34497
MAMSVAQQCAQLFESVDDLIDRPAPMTRKRFLQATDPRWPGWIDAIGKPPVRLTETTREDALEYLVNAAEESEIDGS